MAARVLEGIGGAAVLACGLALLADRHGPGPARVHATVGLGRQCRRSASLPARCWRPPSTSGPAGARRTPSVAVLALVLLLLPSLRGLPESAAAHPRRIDVPGLVLLVAALTLLVSALTQGRTGVDAATVVLACSPLLALRRVRPRGAAGGHPARRPRRSSPTVASAAPPRARW